VRSLVGWIQQLGFLVFFAALTQILLPSGELRKTVRLVVGLVIILAVIEPAVDWIAGGTGSLDWESVTRPAAPVSGGRYVEEGERLAGEAMAGVETAWRAQAERELAAFLNLIPEVQQASVELFLGQGRVQRVRLRLALDVPDGEEAARTGVEERARRLVEGLLPEVNAERVEIVWESASTIDEDGR